MLEKKYKAVLNMAGFLQTHAESLAAKLEELDLEQSVQASHCLAKQASEALCHASKRAPTTDGYSFSWGFSLNVIEVFPTA